MLIFLHTQKLRKQSTSWVGLLNMQRKLKCQGGKEVGEESSICSMISCARVVSVPQLETAWCRVSAHVQLCSWSTRYGGHSAMPPRSPFRNERLRPQVPGVLPVDSLQLSPLFGNCLYWIQPLYPGMCPLLGPVQSNDWCVKSIKAQPLAPSHQTLKGHLSFRTSHEICWSFVWLCPSPFSSCFPPLLSIVVEPKSAP